MEFSDELKKKVGQSIRLLQSVKTDGPIEVCYSGGKDSDVILELAKMAGINYRAIYKNMTIDPPPEQSSTARRKESRCFNQR